MRFTFKKLFQPIRIGSLELKNRYVMNAMHLGFEKNDFVGERTIDFYKERAKGGVGLIIAGGFKVEKIAAGPRVLSIADDRYLPSLRKLTSEVKGEGTKIFAQLFHAGKYVHSSEIGKQAVSASAVRSRLTGEVPHSLSREEIKIIVNKYSESSSRAREAGFDGVEILASTGYLISQFLSPLTNKRDDAYGGGLLNRMRFGLEIAAAIKKEVGIEFPVIFRISGNDFMKGGNENTKSKMFAKELENLEVDAINVQSGWHEAKIPTVQTIVPAGAFVYLASGIKEEVSCPVITSNKLGDPFLAEKILIDHLADLIGLARPLLADPYLPQKVEQGRIDEIIRCINCNQGCLDMVFTRRPVTCMVNPLVGKEREWKINSVQKKKKVLVIGGGPAGMQAAKISAMKGHEVLLCEKSKEIGGQINLAAVLPQKCEFGLLIEDFLTHLIKYGVQIKTEFEVTPEIARELNPDAVVVATGAQQRSYSITGSKKGNVVTVIQVLEDNIEVGKKVVIIGGGSLGCEIALLLATKGVIDREALSFLFRMKAEDIKTLKKLTNKGVKDVSLLTRSDHVGEEIGKTTRWIYLQELNRLNVKIITNAKNILITKEGVCFDAGEYTKKIPADTIIISPGMQPVNDLYKSLKNNFGEIYLIGDAKAPRKAIDAIYEGTIVGHAI